MKKCFIYKHTISQQCCRTSFIQSLLKKLYLDENKKLCLLSWNQRSPFFSFLNNIPKDFLFIVEVGGYLNLPKIIRQKNGVGVIICPRKYIWRPHRSPCTSKYTASRISSKIPSQSWAFLTVWIGCGDETASRYNTFYALLLLGETLYCVDNIIFLMHCYYSARLLTV